MEEGEAAASTSSNSKELSFCEECKTNPSKYKCPSCSFCSCSLPCVKAHKQRNGCTGKRNQTQFVPISQFDDNLLLSDYYLLEEVKRVADSAQRMRNKLSRYNHFRLPFYLKSLRNAAASRRTKLLFLPSGMARREKNQSRYEHKRKTIFWTIELQFHSTDTVIVEHEIDENRSLSSVIESHLQPGPWNHQLRKFCDEQPDNLKFFIRKHHKGSKSPFCELDFKSPIRQLFSNLVILEYPVIYVFLPSQSLNFEVVKDNRWLPHKVELKNDRRDIHPCPEGVLFKEEEILEENSGSCPQVFDLVKHLNSSPQNQNSHSKALNNSLDMSGKETAASCLQLDPMTMELGPVEEMEFDFDQDLLDAYSDMMAEMNPDDFLDYEGGFAKEPGNGTGNISCIGRVNSVEEELEEGEIVE